VLFFSGLHIGSNRQSQYLEPMAKPGDLKTFFRSLFYSKILRWCLWALFSTKWLKLPPSFLLKWLSEGLIINLSDISKPPLPSSQVHSAVAYSRKHSYQHTVSLLHKSLTGLQDRSGPNQKLSEILILFSYISESNPYFHLRFMVASRVVLLDVVSAAAANSGEDN
jgi:hypothetical protein